jgi:hypothetical protein
MAPPSTQSLFARSWRCLDQGDVNRLLRGHYSPVLALTDSCADPTRSPLLRPKPRSRSLCRLRPALAAGGTFPTLSQRILLCVPGPLSRGPVECICLFLPPRHRPSPVHYRGRLPACTRQNDFMTDRLFETAAISLCSGPQVCSPPRSSLPLRPMVAGQPRLYIRAEHASFPPHVSDMLTTRSQAIDGVGTYTPRDSQPCRLLQSNHDSATVSRIRAGPT